MIEIRWLEKERPVDAFVIEGSVSPTYRVLQYRYRYPLEEQSIRDYPPRTWQWSEWQDVPIERLAAVESIHKEKP